MILFFRITDLFVSIDPGMMFILDCVTSNTPSWSPPCVCVHPHISLWGMTSSPSPLTLSFLSLHNHPPHPPHPVSASRLSCYWPTFRAKPVKIIPKDTHKDDVTLTVKTCGLTEWGRELIVKIYASMCVLVVSTSQECWYNHWPCGGQSPVLMSSGVLDMISVKV